MIGYDDNANIPVDRFWNARIQRALALAELPWPGPPCDGFVTFEAPMLRFYRFYRFVSLP